MSRHTKKHSSSQFSAFFKALKRLGVQGRCLEIGCGPGFLTAQIAERYPRADITAVERSRDMIDVAGRHLDACGLKERVRLVHGSADDPELIQGLGQFDLVFSAFSLHHWQHPQRTIATLCRALAPAGTLFIHDLKRVFWLYHLPAGGGFMESIRAAYTPGEVCAMLKSLGRPDHTVNTVFPYFWMNIMVCNWS